MHISPIRRLAAAAAGISLVAAGALVITPPPAADAAIVDPLIEYDGTGALSLAPVGTYQTPVFDAGAAEVVAYHAATEQVFVVNADAGLVEVLDVSNPAAPAKVGEIVAEGVVDAQSTAIPAGTVANSVAVRADGLVVVALEHPDKVSAGWMLVADASDLDPLGAVRVGSLPDMVALSPDGTTALTANEGEPADDYSVDPVGSVSVIDLPSTLAVPAQSDVRTAGFGEFEAGGSMTLDPEVRIFAGIPTDDQPVSRGLEPEYITVDADSQTAWVSLQEANALAVVDLSTATVTDIIALGTIDRGVVPMAMDDRAADKLARVTVDDVYGFFMPDTISSYSTGGDTYIVTANEGDAREWGTYIEPVRVSALNSAGDLCSNFDSAEIAALGRLNVTIANGLNAIDGCYNELYSFGTRSFSIWSETGDLVFDSGELLEEVTSAAMPAFFNAGHDNNTLGNRNDDKGPEPEAIEIGTIGESTYAFVGLERISGIAVFDVTDPLDVEFVTYVNNRDFALDAEDDITTVGDTGPESIEFLSAEVSPTGRPMIVVGNEITGTTTLWSVEPEVETAQVLTINDFHGRLQFNATNREAGAAVLAGAVAALRADNPETVFASAGDNIGASTFVSFSQQDTPTIDALVAAGLDVGAVGNHEFDAGWDDLSGRVLDRFGDPRYGLGANVYLAGTSTPALDEFWVTELAGVSVGFIGVVTEQTATMVSPAGITDIEFGDALEAANRVTGTLTNGNAADGEADIIVLLVHEGPATNDCAALSSANDVFGDLVRGADADIDAIVAGHTHLVVDCDLPVSGRTVDRPVIMAGQYGTHLGQLEFDIDPITGNLVDARSAVIPLAPNGTAAYPADATVAQIVADAVTAANIVGSQEVGAITADITRAFLPGTTTEDRGSESSLGNLIADIQLWATSNPSYGGLPADIALMNPGGLRQDLLFGADGVITYGEIAVVQPFANTLFTQVLTGAQLKSVLEEQWQPDGASRPKLHLGVSDGFEYVYDPAAARGERIVAMYFEGELIQPTDEFRVTTNSFLAGGGDNFDTLELGTERTDTGQVDLAAAVAYFEEFNPVAPASLGRSAVAVEEWATVVADFSDLTVGDDVPVTLTGVDPGTEVTATLFSDPIDLGTYTANSSGEVNFVLSIPTDLEPGTHTLLLEAGTLGFVPISITLEIAGDGALAFTGVEVTGLIAAGLGLIALGAVVMVLRARRRETEVSAAL